MTEGRSLDGDRERWLAAVDNVLKGRPFEQVLVGRTADGLEIQPLYTGIEVAPPPADGAGARGRLDPGRVRDGWDVRQHHGGDDPAQLGRAIVADLERGVTSIELGPVPGGWSVPRLAAALEGVRLDLAAVALAPHADLDAAAALVSSWTDSTEGVATGGVVGLDPYGSHARGEAAPAALATCAEFALANIWPGCRALAVDGIRYVDSGATEGQELAWTTATGVAYLRALVDVGFDVASAASQIVFRLAATADQFVTIAKLRAARRMWARVLEASGVAPTDRSQYQHVVTARAMYSRRDPWVNLLRATTAALAAGVGGADAVTVLPFGNEIGRPDALGLRTARNTQLLLIEESHLARSVDPAGGSWFVESLTDRLAATAWERFQAIERDGGMAAALESGAVEDEIDATWTERLDHIRTRHDPVTGVSEFPHLDEEPVERSSTAQHPNAGWPLRRPAQPFEELRDAADRWLATTGARPSVHLAALGPLAVHSTRSTWISNLLAAGGIAATGGTADGAASPLAAEASFCDSGATVAIICGSDAMYEERGPSTAVALKEAGAQMVVVAGDPGERRAGLVAAGVDEFWHDGIDVVAVLARLHAVLGL